MLPARSLLLCSALLLSFAGTAAGAAEGEVVAGSVKEEGSCASTEAIEKIEPKYKPSQAALTAFFKLHEPTDANWKAPIAVLEVTDGCPLNGMYRRFKVFINEGMTAFPNLQLKTVPGMDPILQFQATATVPDGDLGIARVDVSEMEIGEVEELLQRRGILKDPVLANKAAVMQKEREAKETEMRAASAEKERVVT